ncbi:MAG: prepilin-type N-terminal cleavage/methylation domain-containing protein [Planctomycetaceae bacterium]|jgi:prepilin-type N-terminal cleavage/methylation domain-containing protein|nr:prepilin-type N-terminal cleavage/methylation domain-containing protein [Planctomycetaceae bacterium]
MDSSGIQKGQKQGFTLIELLVVIVIIGILASLALVGGNAAMQAARRTVIKTDLSQLEMALEQYKNKYGEYPPDFSDVNAVMRHVRKRWPRFSQVTIGNTSYSLTSDLFIDQMVLAGWNVAEMEDSGTDKAKIKVYNPDGVGHLAAVTFWLGGLPEGGMLGGFSANVSNPFDLTAQRELPLLEMTIGGNVVAPDENPFGVYFFKSHKYPVVYFRSGYASGGNVKSFTDPDLGTAVPYARSIGSAGDTVWYNDKKFQLIHPGLDGVFGHGAGPRAIDPQKDERVNIGNEDYDNQTNFGGGTTIEE